LTTYCRTIVLNRFLSIENSRTFDKQLGQLLYYKWMRRLFAWDGMHRVKKHHEAIWQPKGGRQSHSFDPGSIVCCAVGGERLREINFTAIDCGAGIT
jgi:hypothetical protein